MSTMSQDVGELDDQKAAFDPNHLVRAARASGRNPIGMFFDFLKLRRKPGKLKINEYLLYELYDKSKWTDEQREEFVSAYVHWPFVNPCNDGTWWALTEDKWLSACFLEKNNVPVPDTIAVYDVGARGYGATECLKSARDLEAFLAKCETFPIFAKPLRGMWSAGAMRISGHNGTHVLVDGKEPMSYADFAAQGFGDTPYIIQTCVKPHSFFDGVTDALPTVRCLNIIQDGVLSVPFTLIKLPLNGNVADNFWRSGNVLGKLNPETGEIENIISVSDGQRIPLDTLPNSERAFIGEQLPNWQELREVNKEVALLHAANSYGSTDIALTENGPVVIEVNNGCAFELIQLATGKGFLTPQMRSFFQGHGVKM